MFWIISLLLFSCWYIGLLIGYTMDGIINILLLIAIIMLIVRVIREKVYCSYLETASKKRMKFSNEGQADTFNQ